MQEVFPIHSFSCPLIRYFVSHPSVTSAVNKTVDVRRSNQIIPHHIFKPSPNSYTSIIPFLTPPPSQYSRILIPVCLINIYQSI